MAIKITGLGSYIPDVVTTNDSFGKHQFLNMDGSAINSDNTIIIEKFKAITGIEERRYAPSELKSSDLGTRAAQKAIDDAGVDPETLDYIICAHNYGDVQKGSNFSDIVPSLASRIKYNLRIKNPKCVAYDILFGCPGWIEGVIQAQAYIKAGMARKCLVIGTEMLSRVVDNHDRDSMIYSDGAGASIIEQDDSNTGILAFETATFTYDEAFFLFNGSSYNTEAEQQTKYIKMYGRKIYNFALTQVPQAMKTCLENSGCSIDEVKKIFIHQANEKMDEAIVSRFYKLHELEMPEHIMPMSIAKLGNSSVATVPTVFDLVRTGALENHEINKGDVIIFASVGAGMNINAIVYRY
ncbi:3-oxoacyl-ACP synthase III family protein [Dokdonia sp. Hel_I_53]|uniref:3-oxoacyl-ACP synthase III family protein n=1 Tax=Dokdonia sp. Hel_I_53 TaxID=1566287 RepID=UPI0011994AAF|nr:3-oxoacyl-ACP synthase III family protein [Dokdonia sp. Hel_I_53]TVZ53151.1 3-oxoacyl-[acyl-carrier-protein] synthase-3 [Dokdonia sp. Hel_I_53]